MVNRKRSPSISTYGKPKHAHISFQPLISRTKRHTIILCRSGKKLAMSACFSVADQPHGTLKKAPTEQLNERITLLAPAENHSAKRS